MTLAFTRLIRMLALVAAFGVVLVAGGAPVSAQQGQQINATAQSLKEENLLKALKEGEAISGRISIPDQNAAALIRPEGREWQDFKRSTLPTIGAIAILGMLVALALFYAVRGRIMIDSGRAGKTIERFGAFDRFVHWLTASSFIVLGMTGLNITFGRSLVLPILGPEAFTALSELGKAVHNYVGFAFIAGVVLTFLIWVKDNLPHARDINWLSQFGGLFSKGNHPPAERFNAGQKVIFWSVVVGGALLSISGLHLLFPNTMGEGVGDMQFKSMLHGVTAMIMVAIILAHIYIGSVGMEGAKDAMTTGQVDLNWAKEHHSLWVERETKARGDKILHPAE